MSHLIPWDFINEEYGKKFKNMKIGAPTKKARVAFGALQIQQQLKITDREVVNQIIENPYLQYFLGYEEYSDKKPFDPSLMVYFRRRLTAECLSKINEKMLERQSRNNYDDDDDDDLNNNNSNKNNNNDDNTNASAPIEKTANNGKLIIDATCAPSDIKYPTDLSLLNEAREKTEKIIDILHAPLIGTKKKVRTYRKKARKDFLIASKNRKLSRNKRRIAIGKQLRYLCRNLKHIQNLSKESSLTLLSNKQYKNLLVINELCRQQLTMYKNKTNIVENRIVNISQPYIRPIVRGKAGKSTEFGAKLSVSVVNGYAFLDRIDWNSYNESQDFKLHVENFKKIHGHYPEAVLCDKIYRNRKNRAFCKEHGIHISGPPLGRKPKNKIKEKYNEGDRNPIEGKFGEAKRRYSLDRIMGKQKETSESIIAMIIVTMNIQRMMRDILLYFFEKGFCRACFFRKMFKLLAS